MGTTGAGKSTAMRELLDGAPKRGDHAVIADSDGAYLSRFYIRSRGDVILNPFDPQSAKWDLARSSIGVLSLRSVIRQTWCPCQSRRIHGRHRSQKICAIASIHYSLNDKHVLSGSASVNIQMDLDRIKGIYETDARNSSFLFCGCAFK
jgi:hypothetical protein